MDFPKDLKYHKEHTWVKVEGNRALIGITDHAQEELGDIVYVELPERGSDSEQDESFGTVESAKAISELFAPISGRVVDINEDLADQPELINDDPYDSGWLVEIEMSDPSELDSLLTADTYKKYIEEEKG
ncbi:MAG: glycine cleavage system protein GcvH [Deltaproteobacteria bacterium]|nr:glycine cleavage system protein GcvH [Deltaproteobacteria bacterium]